MKSYLFGANSPYSHGGDICECSVHMSWPEDSILFMLTRTRNKSNDKMFFFFSFLLVIIRLYPVGVVFGGISMLANALLLWSYDSVSTSPYLPIWVSRKRRLKTPRKQRPPRKRNSIREAKDRWHNASFGHVLWKQPNKFYGSRPDKSSQGVTKTKTLKKRRRKT